MQKASKRITPADLLESQRVTLSHPLTNIRVLKLLLYHTKLVNALRLVYFARFQDNRREVGVVW